MLSSRYIFVAPDGQHFGPVELEKLNEWILENRIIPTSILIPEGAAMRVAANQIEGLVWKPGQTFEAYSKQQGVGRDNKLLLSAVCLLVGVVCGCLRAGVPIVSGGFGAYFAVLCIKREQKLGYLLLVLNMLMIGVGIGGLVLAQGVLTDPNSAGGLVKRVLELVRAK